MLTLLCIPYISIHPSLGPACIVYEGQGGREGEGGGRGRREGGGGG